ncbi:hypothetical protein FRC12_023446 [Ceratobasidium sp. 428]|nr:hypothetical protein FRC12_023446 [Ceratobasidium sp. 428]
MVAFEFKPFTNESTAHGQLQEWADYYHVNLNWKDVAVQTQGVTECTSYPIIQGLHYHEFVGIGGTRKVSRVSAAKRIITCPGALDMAKP